MLRYRQQTRRFLMAEKKYIHEKVLMLYVNYWYTGLQKKENKEVAKYNYIENVADGLQDAGSLFVFCIRGGSKEMYFNVTKKRLVIVSNGFLFDQYHVPRKKEKKKVSKKVSTFDCISVHKYLSMHRRSA